MTTWWRTWWRPRRGSPNEPCRHWPTADSIALAGLEASHRPPTPVATRQRLADVERDHIKHVLDQTGWQKKKASEMLGISRPTLDRKIKTYRLERG